MKSLKPNELHNYIYQSGPEDEAWKLPIGNVRLTINAGQYHGTKLLDQGLTNKLKAEMNHVVEFTVSCFLHAIDPINVTMAYRATSLLLKDLIFNIFIYTIFSNEFDLKR